MGVTPIDLGNIMEAVEALKKVGESRSRKPRFNESVELIVNLKDIDLKRPERRITDVAELPHEIGKKVRICFFASGDMALRAQRAGADLVIDRQEIERIAGDKREAKKLANAYDFFFAEAPLMPLVGRTLGRFLGTRGKMPIPVPPGAPVEDVIARGRRSVRLRMRDQPVLKCRVGTMDMDSKNISENVQAVLNRIEGRLEKGLRNIKSVILKTTMSPKVQVSLGRS
ncbi:MAG: 50S ribosomal protein L1 [Candidatus Bathyarchaeia archaeon]